MKSWPLASFGIVGESRRAARAANELADIPGVISAVFGEHFPAVKEHVKLIFQALDNPRSGVVQRVGTPMHEVADGRFGNARIGSQTGGWIAAVSRGVLHDRRNTVVMSFRKARGAARTCHLRP